MTDTASPRTRHGGHATARGELVIASPTFADWLADKFGIDQRALLKTSSNPLI